MNESELSDLLLKLSTPAFKDYSGAAHILLAEVTRLRDGIKKLLEEGVQETSGPYNWKNNQCLHNRYGYEGCEQCTDAFLTKLLNGDE